MGPADKGGSASADAGGKPGRFRSLHGPASGPASAPATAPTAATAATGFGGGRDIIEPLRLFLGRGVFHYLNHLQRRRGSGILFGFNPLAMILPLSWLFYRKLVLQAVLLFLILALVAVSFDYLVVAVAYGVICLFMGIFATGLYLGHARQYIAAIEAKDAPAVERDRKLLTLGGVSFAGGVLGFLMTAVVATIAVIGHLGVLDTALGVEVPGCDDPRLDKEPLVMAGGGKVAERFDLRRDDPRIERTCLLSVDVQGRRRSVLLKVYWRSRARQDLGIEPIPQETN